MISHNRKTGKGGGVAIFVEAGTDYEVIETSSIIERI